MQHQLCMDQHCYAYKRVAMVMLSHRTVRIFHYSLLLRHGLVQ